MKEEDKNSTNAHITYEDTSYCYNGTTKQYIQ